MKFKSNQVLYEEINETISLEMRLKSCYFNNKTSFNLLVFKIFILTFYFVNLSLFM